ncbi:NADP-dependent oxidoreductase [Streptomyces sp. NPDC006643]|uniref:NADP-dependent oxidoreductase n=2 Tax=unclassified Streptomyces TaxID=2593676 RepID=UPI003677A4BC
MRNHTRLVTVGNSQDEGVVVTGSEGVTGTMEAVVAEDYCRPEKFSVRQIDIPLAGPGQIQVRIRAAAVNPLDTHLVSGDLRESIPMEFPQILGNDFSGTVSGVGEGVMRYAVGDEIFGVAFPRCTVERVRIFSEPPSLTTGTLAEYAVFEADSPVIAPRPAELEAEQAAGLPMVGLTAISAVRAGEFKAGDTVLVIGATGGVGNVVVPLLVSAGVKVIATAIAEDQGYIRDRGAHEVIDYRADDIADEALKYSPDGVDGVINLALGDTLINVVGRAVRPGGRVMTVSYTSPQGATFREDLTVKIIYAATQPGDMTELIRQAVDGSVPLPGIRRYPLGEGAKAFTDLVGVHTCGKLVVLPA